MIVRCVLALSFKALTQRVCGLLVASQLLRFALGEHESLPDWHLVQHVRVRENAEAKAQRDYTIVSHPGTKGYFELLVKVLRVGIRA